MEKYTPTDNFSTPIVHTLYTPNMAVFTLGLPLEVSGVYIIRNKITKHVYVGQSVNLQKRYLYWLERFKGAPHRGMSDVFRRAVNVVGPENWEFVVFEFAPRSELVHLETELICRFREMPGVTCLNKTHKTVWSGPLSVVRDENGVALGYTELARRSGVTKQAVKKRLAYWRRRGRNEFTLEDFLKHAARL